MPSFTYTARTSAGKKTEGTIEAPDRRAALAQLDRLGQIPISVVEGRVAPAAPAAAKKGKGLALKRRAAPRKMKTRDLLDFTDELSDLLAAGMKLSAALGTMAARRTATASDAVIAKLRDDITRGASLSEALAQHPESFPNLYVNLIRAGEASGALAEILHRLSEHYERIQDTKEKLTMALVYPSFILAAGVITVFFTMIFVIPRFSKIFEDLHSTLPLPTRMLIAMSQGAVDYWWAMLAVIGIVTVLATRTLKSDRGRAWWHATQLRLPLIKGVITSSAYSQFARTLRTLLGNGVHVLQALAIVEQTMGNSVIAREIRNARDRVTDGTSISGPLAAGKVFPPLLTDMLAVGEQTGDMPSALAHIAKRYENQLDRQVRVMMTALEPILIFMIAIVVGFVVISMLLAVFDLTSGLKV